MDLSKYDNLLARILEEEKQIFPFLDAIFGFLWRRTDFFVMQKEGGKIGFPQGGAERILRSAYYKWQKCARTNSKYLSSDTDVQSKIVNRCTDKEKTAENEKDNTSSVKVADLPSNVNNESKVSEPKKDIVSCSDTYNGADQGTYRWSQTISDIDVLIPVPEYIKKSKDVDVHIGDSRLIVKIKDKSNPSEWNSLVDGDLCYRINKEESLWSLSSGQQISIHCEKHEERWWYGLLASEPKLDSTKFDASRPMSDLSQEEQMKVEEMMWNEERKMLGLKTSEQMKTEKILKDAWNIEGSPFQGTKFDPSILDVKTDSSMNLPE